MKNIPIHIDCKCTCCLQDMHLLAERCILRGLKAAGVVTGDVEEMLAKRIGALFMPHGKTAACLQAMLWACHSSTHLPAVQFRRLQRHKKFNVMQYRPAVLTWALHCVA